MKKIVTLLLFCAVFLGYAQDKDVALQASNNLVYEGNELIADNEFVSAEMEYRKAISKKPNNAIANYDLGNAYYNDGKFNEALLRHTEAVEHAETKEQKHSAWHNIGNALMKADKCQEAVEAFKNALRNNPNDDETRYNFGLAKECAKKQQEEEDDKKDKGDKDKDNEKKDGDDDKDKGDEEQKEDKGDEDKKNKGDDEKDDKGDPKDEKQDENKDGKPDDQKKQPQPQPGQLSPQQIKNLLEAMNNQEQKVQDKINAKKTKGVKVQTDKDW